MDSYEFLMMPGPDVPALQDLVAELASARSKHGNYRSAHEAYAVLSEEVDEFWDEVKRKDSVRDYAAMRAELVQVAAVAIRAIGDLDGRGE